ncbi:unnamed protein product, partial [Heterotrigona itama]
IAVAVVDRSRLGPETNVYTGTARARTCERTTITMIDGRPYVLGLAFARASHPKKRRGPANCQEEGCIKWLIILWMRNPSRAWEVILVTTLSLCSLLMFV